MRRKWTVNKQKRIAVCGNFLIAEGYRPDQNDEGDLVFKSEGHLFAIILEEDDPLFYRLVFPNFWAMENEAERTRAIIAAHEATVSTKVAKIFFVENQVWAGIELFCEAPEHFTAVFERSLSAVKAAVNTFVETMRAGQK
jgi:hypothetical protein